MQQQKWKGTDLSRHGRPYLLVKAAAVLMVLALLPAAHSADNWNVDGANGVLRVHGALAESACRLEMESAYQDVWVGETGTARLAQIGAQGTPVVVQLRLRDCLRSPANNRDERSGNLLWAPYQPAVLVSFSAPADVNNPQLVKVRGASGLALRMSDSLGRDIRLGSRGAPLMIAAGQDTLNYTVTPERTRAPLQAGAYSAQLNFKLNYD
jgi:type 1 fimbria pilin